jgi:hypothetical protein
MATKLSETGVVFPNLTTQTTAGVTVATGGTGISVSAANGAVTFTNSGVTSLVAGSGISVSGATGAVTVTASGGGTVTSVATGNGLSGGTITSTGTLVVAAPSWNSVGSYVFGSVRKDSTATISYDSNVSAGLGDGQIAAMINTQIADPCIGRLTLLSDTRQNVLSGTWKMLNSVAGSNQFGSTYNATVAVRVS